MKLKTVLRRLLLLTLCMALMLPAAGAVNAGLQPAPDSNPTTYRTWGTISRTQEGSLLLTNDSGEEGTYDQLILYYGADTLIVDAVTGDPLTLDDVKDGTVVCVNVDTMMLMSYPAQTYAYLILANLPEAPENEVDPGAPGYYQVTDYQMTSTMMTENNEITLEIQTDYGLILYFYMTDQLDESGTRQYILKDESAVEIAAYTTKNIVSVTDLIPGTRFLLWTDSTGKPTRILTVPYAYRGWLETDAEFDSAVRNGVDYIDGAKKDAEGQLMLPLRALCETAGMTVDWKREDNSIVVSDNGETVFTCTIGNDEVHKNGAMAYLQTVTAAEDGVTYLRAFDLAWLLDLYHIAK